MGFCWMKGWYGLFFLQRSPDGKFERLSFTENGYNGDCFFKQNECVCVLTLVCFVQRRLKTV